jgi:hypothetical protein
MYRRILENCPSGNLPGYGPALLIKRPVRTRMQGVVGAGGVKPPATRLSVFTTMPHWRYQKIAQKIE